MDRNMVVLVCKVSAAVAVGSYVYLYLTPVKGGK
jgi:hypothetical protein